MPAQAGISDKFPDPRLRGDDVCLRGDDVCLRGDEARQDYHIQIYLHFAAIAFFYSTVTDLARLRG